MNKRQAKRRRDIKSKLMAAICMLMVSSIMMVSTTYAWFTLSTAPEVTGINTAVGANGNLEMALLPLSGDTADITSSSGDSLEALKERNITWGNLVDLSDAATYGLDQITLYPAALNAATEDAAKNPLTIGDLMLETPTYGSDGRVEKLEANTFTSTYGVDKNNATTTNFPQNDFYGVRAVGTASGMTDRQLAYRNALSAANTAMSQAKAAASTSLSTNGSALANIAIKKGTEGNSATFTSTDVNSLKAIVNDLLNENTGVLQYIENAYKNYIIAMAASKKSQTNVDDTAFSLLQSSAEGKTVYDLVTWMETEGNVTLDTNLKNYIQKVQATRSKVTEAQTRLNAITDETDIAWSTISEPLKQLADPDAMLINGFKASELMSQLGELVSSVTTQGGLVVTMATGGGVYADVADHCGDYTASVNIERVEYNGIVLNDMAARMVTKTDVTPDVYLNQIKQAVKNAEAPESAGGQTMPISDMFGYIVDLAFRTNAAESNLLLQIEGADRIYDSNSDQTADTWGDGSTMTFTSVTTDFTTEQMKELMKAIRIVFFDPATKAVKATARLNMTEAELEIIGGQEITAKMELYKLTTATTTYTVFADETTLSNAVTAGTKIYRKTTGTEGTADTYSEVTETSNLSFVADTYYYATTTEAGTTALTDTTLMPLTQNVAAKLSVLVYLDGELVGNEDVAATAATSMTGTMNLQFASSANLVPMEYTALMNQGQTSEDQPATPTTYTVAALVAEGVTDLSAASVAEKTAVTFKLAEGYKLDSVTVGGQAITTPTAVEGLYTIPADSVTGDVVINVSLESATN